jgi:hypothetical protein
MVWTGSIWLRIVNVFIVLSRVLVTIDGVRVGNWGVYMPQYLSSGIRIVTHILFRHLPGSTVGKPR